MERSIKELLQLTLTKLEATPKTHVTGICSIVYELCLYDHITYKEFQSLESHIQRNLPSRRYTRNNGYKWKPGTKTCRIKWLNKQINSL